MTILSVFNNKGGVGKTTLTFHLSYALSEMGHKVLMIDADPQCNLTIFSVSEDKIYNIWKDEDKYIDEGFESTIKSVPDDEFEAMGTRPRSLHYLLKPTEEGTGDPTLLPPPLQLENTNVAIIPGRLSLHTFEEKISSRWTDLYRGDPLAIRTILKIRSIAESYTEKYGFDFVIIDTSPSLGSLNKTVISTVDGFFVPAAPDLFSLYGIKNIGKALKGWQEEFNIIYGLLSSNKLDRFPKKFVQFLGYTIHNARPYKNEHHKWNLAKAHLKYAAEIPRVAEKSIDKCLREHLPNEMMNVPIGDDAIMYTYNTFPSNAQRFNVPMWKVPETVKNGDDIYMTVTGQRKAYAKTKDNYVKFANDLLKRVALLKATQ